MDIKRNETMLTLAKETDFVIEILAKRIIDRCIDYEVFESDDEGCFGIDLKAIAFDAGITTKVLFSRIIGKDKLTTLALESFEKLIFIGDGGCPECGGDCEERIPENAELVSYDYDSEPEWNAETFKECVNCSYVI